TFYVLAVYFGSVGIRRYRYAIVSGLLADFVTLVASVVVVGKVYGIGP
ncbi:MAG: spore maturation protein, partial [Desulfotomaculales bacterium]